MASNYSEMCQVDVGRSSMVSVTEWKGEKKIHFRRFTLENGRKRSTKDGITLTIRRWKELISNKEAVNQALQDIVNESDVNLSIHLGGNWYVRVNSKYPGVSIRRFWFKMESEELLPSRNGVHLHKEQWENVMLHLKTINSALPELESTIPCSMEDDHMNQEGYLNCSECSPNYKFKSYA